MKTKLTKEQKAAAKRCCRYLRRLAHLIKSGTARPWNIEQNMDLPPDKELPSGSFQEYDFSQPLHFHLNISWDQPC